MVNAEGGTHVDAMVNAARSIEWVDLPQPAWYIDSPRFETEAADRDSSAAK
ncbi:MAG: hypothetical protein LJE93_06340 [Acidobacteria bacterium]|jgi:hypothetical protein|nr:hypothetical protein [Acidobacteriota bacterium]